MTGACLAWFAGAVLIAVGSIGPWATSPFSSASGTSGDGVITLVAAVVLAVLAVAPNRFAIFAFLVILVAGGVGIYDFFHIRNELHSFTIGGVQVDHVGWGLYVVVVGVVITVGGVLKRPLFQDEI